MTKLPRLTARQIISVLQKAGFSLARQSGSHIDALHQATPKTSRGLG